MPLSRSTFDQLRPRNSEARIPVKIAVMTSGAPASGRCFHQSAQFGPTREIPTLTERAGFSVAGVVLYLDAASDVLGDPASRLSESENGFQIGDHLTAHGQRSAGRTELVDEVHDPRHGQRGELFCSHEWDDMQSQMLATLFDSAAFKIVCFTVGYPRFPRFGNCLARAGRRVNALLNFVSCGDSPGVGF